ncbi:uncharacterized protein V6R79_013252 [Siganus canaliculatus]
MWRSFSINAQTIIKLELVRFWFCEGSSGKADRGPYLMSPIRLSLLLTGISCRAAVEKLWLKYSGNVGYIWSKLMTTEEENFIQWKPGSDSAEREKTEILVRMIMFYLDFGDISFTAICKADVCGFTQNALTASLTDGEYSAAIFIYPQRARIDSEKLDPVTLESETDDSVRSPAEWWDID